MLARLQTCEDEIAKLREFRHRYTSDSVGLMLKVEALDVRVKHLAESVTGANADRQALNAEVDRIHVELRDLKAGITLKHAEYDRERSVVSKIGWPIIITLAVAFAMWLVSVMLKMV